MERPKQNQKKPEKNKTSQPNLKEAGTKFWNYLRETSVSTFVDQVGSIAGAGFSQIKEVLEPIQSVVKNQNQESTEILLKHNVVPRLLQALSKSKINSEDNKEHTKALQIVTKADEYSAKSNNDNRHVSRENMVKYLLNDWLNNSSVLLRIVTEFVDYQESGSKQQSDEIEKKELDQEDSVLEIKKQERISYLNKFIFTSRNVKKGGGEKIRVTQDELRIDKEFKDYLLRKIENSVEINFYYLFLEFFKYTDSAKDKMRIIKNAVYQAGMIPDIVYDDLLNGIKKYLKLRGEKVWTNHLLISLCRFANPNLAMLNPNKIYTEPSQHDQEKYVYDFITSFISRMAEMGVLREGKARSGLSDYTIKTIAEEMEYKLKSKESSNLVSGIAKQNQLQDNISKKSSPVKEKVSIANPETDYSKPSDYPELKAFKRNYLPLLRQAVEGEFANNRDMLVLTQSILSRWVYYPKQILKFAYRSNQPEFAKYFKQNRTNKGLFDFLYIKLLEEAKFLSKFRDYSNHRQSHLIQKLYSGEALSYLLCEEIPEAMSEAAQWIRSTDKIESKVELPPGYKNFEQEHQVFTNMADELKKHTNGDERFPETMSILRGKEEPTAEMKKIYSIVYETMVEFVSGVPFADEDTMNLKTTILDKFVNMFIDEANSKGMYRENGVSINKHSTITFSILNKLYSDPLLINWARGNLKPLKIVNNNSDPQSRFSSGKVSDDIVDTRKRA